MGRKSLPKLVLVVLIVMALPLMSLGAAAKPAKPSGIAWMVLYYLDGDTGDYVEGMCLHDLEELQSAPHNRVKTIAIIDRWSSWDGAGDSNARYYDVGEGSMTLMEDLGEVNMGEPGSLSDFIIWAKATYEPATHYALILANHGMGWRGVCGDNGDYLDMRDLHIALDAAKNDTGIVFDVIGFDACIMAELEVAYQIKDYAKVMVASQELTWIYDEDVPGGPPSGTAGLPNDAIITSLSNNYRTDAAGFATIIVNEYADFWEHYQPEIPDYPRHDQTLSAIYLQTKGMADLITGVEKFSLCLLERIPTYESEIIACLESDDFVPWQAIDLYHFVDLIDAQNMDESRAMEKAMEAIRNSIVSITVAEWHEVDHWYAHGVNIYYTPFYFIWYSSIDFCQPGAAPNWNNFLKDILNFPT